MTDIWTMLGLFVGAFMIMAIYSIVLGELNLAFRLATNIFVAVAAGIAFVFGVKSIISSTIPPVNMGDYVPLIPVVLGLLLFTRLSKKYLWISRWPAAILVGVGTGLSIRGTIQSEILTQTLAASPKLISSDPTTTVNTIITFLLTLCALSYFFFVKKIRTRALDITAKIGIGTLMAMFGAMFGSTIVTRLSLMTGILDFLLRPDMPYYTAAALVTVLASIILPILMKRSRPAT